MPTCSSRLPCGYRLALSEDKVDCAALLLHVSDAADKARAGDHAGALAEAEAGLELWGGPGAADAGAVLGDPVAALRSERAGAHRALERVRALELARTGRREEAAARLGELVRELPRDEELLLELVRCEAATSGTAAALTTYDRYRRRLRDELGTDPGPALRALHQELLREEAPTVRRGVPHEPNELLGRNRDLDAVAELLRSSRVTTVLGPGGLGKTRLAGAVSRAAEQRLVHMVPLAGVTDDADVAGEVAAALGVADAPRTPAGGPPGELVAGLVAALGPGPALLVLDNCEQVVRGVAELVRELVASSRDLRVLTTSRTPLGLSSESVYLLPELDRATTVELFTRRARAARPDVELPPDTVDALCRRLDGLPLAAELAAARVRVLSVAEIDRRLGDRFALLRGGSRDAPQRHRTLHAVVDWSWNLLTSEGRAALRALSVFPGGFTADSACHLLDGGEGNEGETEASGTAVTMEPSGTAVAAGASAASTCSTSWISSRTSSTSRCSRSRRPRPAPGSTCWRPSGSSARPGGPRRARARRSSADSPSGPGTSGSPTMTRPSAPTRTTPGAGSVPTRTTCCGPFGSRSIPTPVPTCRRSPPPPRSSAVCGRPRPTTPASSPSRRTPGTSCRATGPRRRTSRSPVRSPPW